MRSLLFVPGDSTRKFERALVSGADAIVLDLEDSVAEAAKLAARGLVSDFVAGNRDRPSRPLILVRPAKEIVLDLYSLSQSSISLLRSR